MFFHLINNKEGIKTEFSLLLDMAPIIFIYDITNPYKKYSFLTKIHDGTKEYYVNGPGVYEVEVEFSHNINCLVGNNGVGKTNLLDAIYYLSFSKSYFNSLDNQNIKYNEPYFAIHGNYIFTDQSEMQQISCIQKRGQSKQIKFNKKLYSRISDHIGKIPLVMISPYDHELIQGGSEVRRKFLDGVISQTDNLYLEQLLQYQKALEQRNRLLKTFYEDRYFDEAMLSLWDEQLVRLGQPIYEKRKIFLESFCPIFNSYYSVISASEEPVFIEYDSQIHNGNYTTLLRETWTKDAYAQYTTVGIHKDDLNFKIGEELFSVKKFGSQGQQKTFVLALKLAQFEYIAKSKQVKPILLLDDVFDKLDIVRVHQLIHLVAKECFGQVFLTDTQQGRVEEIFKDSVIEHKIFTVEKDKVIVQ